MAPRRRGPRQVRAVAMARREPSCRARSPTRAAPCGSRRSRRTTGCIRRRRSRRPSPARSRPSPQYTPFTTSRRSPSFSRSVAEPIVVVRIRFVVPLSFLFRRVHDDRHRRVVDALLLLVGRARLLVVGRRRVRRQCLQHHAAHEDGRVCRRIGFVDVGVAEEVRDAAQERVGSLAPARSRRASLRSCACPSA